MDERVNHYLNARHRARKLAGQHADQLGFARKFLAGLLLSYFPSATPPPVPPLTNKLAMELGFIAQGLDPQMAAYLISTTYTVMLPPDYRGKYGVFYTPPALVGRLLDLAQKSGVDWSTAQVLDPACGGGAFLAPVAQRMRTSLSHLSPQDRIGHIEKHLAGMEIDPFSAWMSQVFVEIALKDDIACTGRRMKDVIEIRDSLKTDENHFARFDLVVGNPPYGRIKLSGEEREKWRRSLFGHANQYGLFSDLATRLVRPGGTIAYVTPTSFLGGQYFQALRKLLSSKTPPIAIDFIAHREGVFDDALQEALIAVYKKSNTAAPIRVSYLSLMETGKIAVQENGTYSLPDNPGAPWILPRNPEQSRLATLARHLPTRLADLGYTVSTGPLVWNRHKEKLLAIREKGAVPLVWAECIDQEGTGTFTFKATGRNHVPWYMPTHSNDANLVRKGCVLLQRTTSLEQSRRLIAAELSQEFIDQYGGAVTVENHLNMVRPIPSQKPLVSLSAIVALLNSYTVDQIFRCINGSAAVSAYELEAMPLPSPKECKKLESMLDCGAARSDMEQAIKEMYCNVRLSAAA